MQKDERDLLEVLKSELEFLESHGYRRSPETAWRPKYIFEDSPTCTNYHFAENPRPCTECTLIHLVPPTLRSAKSPCRHIPLNESGDTLDSLYRYGTQRQIDDVMRTWLRAAITRLEEERKAVKAPKNRSWLRGTPLYTKQQHPKCANPACSTAFHWTGGGKVLRLSAGSRCRDRQRSWQRVRRFESSLRNKSLSSPLIISANLATIRIFAPQR